MAPSQRSKSDLSPGPGSDLVHLFRQLRLIKPLTNGEIVIKTGLSRAHVSEVLTGRKSPSPAAAAKLANALGGSPDEILKARSLAEQQTELNRYHRRTRDTTPSPTRTWKVIDDDTAPPWPKPVTPVAPEPVGDLRAGSGAARWRNRRNLSLLASAMLPVGTVRVSFAALLRIKDDDGYVLLHTPYTPGSFGPPGGVFKVYPSADPVLDRIGFREQRKADRVHAMRSDLRGFVPACKLAPFIRWYLSGADRESATECLRRELAEELVEIGNPELIPDVDGLMFERVRTVREGPRKVAGQNYRQLRRFEIYDLLLTDESSVRLRLRLLDLARRRSENMIAFATSQEIIDGRCRDLLIGPQSAFLFGPKRYRGDLPPMS